MTDLTKADLLALLKKPGAFAQLADNDKYLEAQTDPVRAQVFRDAELPDPCVVRAWWAGQQDLPTTEPNYQKWLALNVLAYAAILPGSSFHGLLVAELDRLEYLIRQELKITPSRARAAVAATEAAPPPAAPAKPAEPKD